MSGWTDADLRAALEQAKAEADSTRPPRAKPGQVQTCAGCGRDSREVAVYQRKATGGTPLCRACYHRWQCRHDPELVERDRQRGRRWRQTHREKTNAYNRRYRQTHREEINAYRRRYRARKRGRKEGTEER